MRTFLRSLLIAFLGLLLVAPPAGAGTSRSRRQPTMSELKRDANRVAARFGKAQATYERINNEIAKIGRQIDQLRREIAPLRHAVTRRGAAVYKGGRGFDVVSGLAQISDPVKSGRGAHFVEQANAADVAVIERLDAAVAELTDRQQALNAKQHEQQVALDQLDSERRDLDAKLQEMVRAEQALQSRLVKAREAAAARASRVRRAPPAPPPVDPASIPVVTGFICPIRGPLAFADTFGDPRGGGRRHQGTDLMSPHGSDNVAVVSGTIERHHSGAGGLGIYLYGDDGHTYYYAHLSEVEGPDRRVGQGELIGKTGATGNARGGSPHTHFEIHPNGGKAVNSYATLAAHC